MEVQEFSDLECYLEQDASNCKYQNEEQESNGKSEGKQKKDKSCVKG